MNSMKSSGVTPLHHMDTVGFTKRNATSGIYPFIEAVNCKCHLSRGNLVETRHST